MSARNGKLEHTFWPGEEVRVLTNYVVDIVAGSTGIYDEPCEGGHWVKLDGNWLVAGNDRGATVRENRTMWYPDGHIERV